MLLAIHGLGSDASAMRAYLDAAVPPGVQVLAPDLRAHGSNPLIGGPDDFALDAMADEVADALVRHGDGSPVSIVGVSLGAALAARIARSGRFPLDRVALVRPSFTTEPLPPNLSVFPLIGRLLGEHPPARALEHLRRSGAWRAIAHESLAHAHGLESLLTQPLAAERRIRLVEIPRNTGYEPGALRIPAPTVVLASPRDPVHPVHVAEAWAAEVGCRMLVSPARDDGEDAMYAWFRRQLGSFLVGIR
ncbi:alpha/beta fold hydrolase [Agrococcus carbonis]|uniref:Lysophospholipase, alpha-beta hydrolase superfamily n=1 Tax=Agrococcus carbonis TaxID=684552 RepID=A0A1H1MK59_9MICO|nr:alpha/beta fold hydrolase [Agrococcus carbonis]SDR87002.1 Lysophospholipase, alpha-beta hydrolase superfamily [Agrococcus carbonis]